MRPADGTTSIIWGKTKSDCDAAQQALLTAESTYAYQQEALARQNVQELIAETKNSLTNLEVYLGNISEWLQVSGSQSAELEHSSATAMRDFGVVNTEREVLKQAMRVLASAGCKLSELREIYERNRIGLYNASRLAQLTDALCREAILPLFESLITSESTSADLLDKIDRLHSKKKSDLESQHALLQFAQMNAEGRFGGWALREGKALSKEAESVLMYLKNLPIARTVNPVEGARVVTRPDILLQNIAFTPDDAANGFWLSFNGLEEFIRYAPGRLFTVDGIKTLPQQLSALAAVSQMAIDVLEAEVADLGKLRNVLQDVPKGAKEALAAYRYFESGSKPRPNIDLDIPEKEFEGYLHALEKEASIMERFTAVESAMKEAMREKARFEALTGDMQTLKADVQGILNGSQWTEQLRSVEKEMLPANYYNDPAAIAKQTSDEASLTINFGTFYRTKIDEAKAAHRTAETLEAYRQYKEAVSARNQHWRAHSIQYGKEPDINLIVWGHVEEPVEERSRLISISAGYDAQFSQIVKQHVTDQHKFERSKDYDELCATILPDILGKNRPEGLSNIKAFRKYLHDINEKNKGINARKLQKIKELLDDVQNEVGTRMHNARSIDTFLNRKEREITGGHRVRVDLQLSRQYPLKWLTDYADRMPVDGTLFAPEGETIERLTATGVSLEEKMREAFYQLGGDRMRKVTIEKLLDPNSYFDLTFSIQSQTHEKNKGSTGQTYTAVALLCIARLSRVEQGIQASKGKGIRFMPIDEAEGLGTNYDMLHKVAKDYDYQIISMSINPLSSSARDGRHLYDLRKNSDSDEDINLTPMAVFEDADNEA